MTNQRNIAKENMLKQSQAAAAAVADNAVEARFDRLAQMTSGASAPAAAVAASLAPLPPVKFLDVDDIKNREKDIRPLHVAHVVDLAMSFVAVGMLHFPIVDQHNVLLAGGHRKEAVALLKAMRDAPLEQIRETFDRNPVDDPLSDSDVAKIQGAYDRHFKNGLIVHVFDTTGLDEVSIRREVEFIENDHRKDFTKEEIKQYVVDLEAAGYKRTEGRPKPGQRVLSVELARIIGKSRATVFRVLKEMKNPKKTEREGPSQSSLDIEKKASAHLETKVRVRESPSNREEGAIIIHYSSFKQRSALLRELGLKD